MKILPVKTYTHQQKPAFNGHFKYYGGCWSSECFSDTKPTTIAAWDCTNRIQNTVRYDMNPYATVQRTVEDFHSVYTSKVYIADPLEFVTNDKRMEADYIVYDNEPPYPDVHNEVSKSYFEQDEANYAKRFSDIRDYYKRLENADRVSVEEYRNKILAGVDVEQSKEKLDFYNSRIQCSQYQQWQAQECLDLYNKGYDLRMLKGKSQLELRFLRDRLGSYQRDVETNEWAINNANKSIKAKNETIEMLNKRLSLYQQLIELPKEINNEYDLKWNHEGYVYSYFDLRLVPNENELINDRLPQLKGVINCYKNGVNNLLKKIEEYKADLTKLSVSINKVKQEISQQEKLIADTKARLIPLFDELKNFYAKQRIIK